MHKSGPITAGKIWSWFSVLTMHAPYMIFTKHAKGMPHCFAWIGVLMKVEKESKLSAWVHDGMHSNMHAQI